MVNTIKNAHDVHYSSAIAKRILSGVRAGRSLVSICRDDDLPDESSVRYWVQRDHRGFTVRYHRARIAGLTERATRRAAIIERILVELSEGRTLRSICRDKGMPPYTTFLGWIARNPKDYDVARM